MRGKHFSITIKAQTISAGSSYGTGANIYKTGLPSELVKIASIYISAENRLRATSKALELILCEIDNGSTVSIAGEFLGTHNRRVKRELSNLIKDKRLTVYTSNAVLERDNKDLAELAKHAAARKSSVIADI
jgi:hypothetical protein